MAGSMAKFEIPDSVRLAQYDAKTSIEDVAQNLSSKYKQLASEIRHIIESILRQSTANQDQINFRLANKLLQDERAALYKFLNDDSFSPDIDSLVTAACDSVMSDINVRRIVAQNDIDDLKKFLINEIKAAEKQIGEAGRKAIDEIKAVTAQTRAEAAAAAASSAARSTGGGISFDSFGGIRYFTGWLTASFITRFERTQIAAFNRVGGSIDFIESMFRNMAITEQVKAASRENQVKEVVKEQERRITSSPIDLGNSFGARTVTMILQLRSRQSVQNKTKSMVLAGMAGIAHGMINAVDSVSKEIARISVDAVKKTIETSSKLLHGIINTAVWTVDKLFNNIIGWSIAAAIIWKFWLSDKFKKSVTDWMTDWAHSISKTLKIDKFAKYVKEYYTEKIYNRYLKKFDDYFTEKWGAGLNNLKEYLRNKVKPLIEWARTIRTKLSDAVHKNFETAANVIGDSWTFLTKKVLAKPFSLIVKTGGDMFQAMRDAGDWLWGLMTGKLSWSDASRQLKEGWHVVVGEMHDTMREIVNFTKINGNWILDFLGVPVTTFRFDVPVDENGNVLSGDDAKSMFTKAKEGIMGFGKESREIILDEASGAKLTINPLKLGEGALKGGVMFTWSHGSREHELKLMGVDETTEKLKKLANDVSGMMNVIAGGAMVYTGGIIGAWVGRIAGLVVTAISAIFSGGAALAGAGTAMNLGGSIGNIVGSLIGYFFFNSLTESKEYFTGASNYNVAEGMGVTKEAASALENAWKMDGVRQAAGITMPSEYAMSKGQFSPSLKEVDNLWWNEDNRREFEQMGFSKDAYDRFSKLFSLAAGDRKRMGEQDRKTYDILSNAIAKEGENFFTHFDSGLEDMLKRNAGIGGKEDFGDLLKLQAAGPENITKIAKSANGSWIKDPAEFYRSLTTTGNDWVDMMLKHVIDQNRQLSFEEFKFAWDRRKEGGWGGNGMSGWHTMYPEDYDDPSKLHWAAIPIMRSLMSLRTALTYFQIEVQRHAQNTALLFPDPLEGEKKLMQGVERMLLDIVYNKTDEQNRELAQTIWSTMFNRMWIDQRRGKDLMESTRILFSHLMDSQQDIIFVTNQYQGFFNALLKGNNALNEFERIKSILDVIQPYADLMRSTALKISENTTLRRKDISEILYSYPNAIGLLLSSGEIGEAFKNKYGKASDLSDDARIEELKRIFSVVDNSLVEAMNAQMTSILENFDNLSENNNEELKRQLEDLLAKVEDSNWIEKIRNKMESGLVFETEFNNLTEKIKELKEELKKRDVQVKRDYEKNTYVVYMPESKTLGQKEQEDSAKARGANKLVLNGVQIN